MRLDLFGDELEGVRAFDPMSQRTTEKRDGVALKPMSEVFLDEQSVARFRSGYRELFGVVLDEDPLYEAVSAGRKHGGMEHWLPLFHSTMETILDYVPDAAVTLDPQAEELRDSRFSQIADFYHARKTLQSVEKKANNPVYKPLPPAMLFLDEASWDDLLAARAVGQLTSFRAGGGAGWCRCGGTPGPGFRRCPRQA